MLHDKFVDFKQTWSLWKFKIKNITSGRQLLDVNYAESATKTMKIMHNWMWKTEVRFTC